MILIAFTHVQMQKHKINEETSKCVNLIIHNQIAAVISDYAIYMIPKIIR